MTSTSPFSARVPIKAQKDVKLKTETSTIPSSRTSRQESHSLNKKRDYYNLSNLYTTKFKQFADTVQLSPKATKKKAENALKDLHLPYKPHPLSPHQSEIPKVHDTTHPKDSSRSHSKKDESTKYPGIENNKAKDASLEDWFKQMDTKEVNKLKIKPPHRRIISLNPKAAAMLLLKPRATSPLLRATYDHPLTERPKSSSGRSLSRDKKHRELLEPPEIKTTVTLKTTKSTSLPRHKHSSSTGKLPAAQQSSDAKIKPFKKEPASPPLKAKLVFTPEKRIDKSKDHDPEPSNNTDDSFGIKENILVTTNEIKLPGKPQKVEHNNKVHFFQRGHELEIHTENSYTLHLFKNSNMPRETPQFREFTFDCKETTDHYDDRPMMYTEPGIIQTEPTYLDTEPFHLDSEPSEKKMLLKEIVNSRDNTSRRHRRRESHDSLKIWKHISRKWVWNIFL